MRGTLPDAPDLRGGGGRAVHRAREVGFPYVEPELQVLIRVELVLRALIRLQRIHNFRCPMLVFTPFA
jgi:hypothetical protein